MSLITIPIDDTLQLDEMASSPDDRNLPPITESLDRVAIVQPLRHDTDVNINGAANNSDSDSSNFESSKSPLQRNPVRPAPRGFTCRAIIAVAVLTLVNLLNYMDRFTIAGVLSEVMDTYDIDKSQGGLLQTAFICSYMILSPVFGYLGDRYNRKLIIVIGVAIWSSVTLGSSYVPSNHFWLFVVMRGLVGIGEASYSTIAPTLIADLFVKDQRTKALGIFYIAIPFGSGMGYIAGASIANHMGSWRWALRLTPALGFLCVLLLIFIVREPPRGASEGGSHHSNTPWLVDLKYLVKNKTFMLSTFGFTAVAFVAGSLSWWGQMFIELSVQIQGEWNTNVAIIFGTITCLAGLLGVIGGTFGAQKLRAYTGRSDTYVCAFGLILCAPFLFLALVISQYDTTWTWILIFIAELFMCLNWAIVTDILLYVVVPTRRSTAEAFQILISHLLGDAGSPYLVGKVSDHIGGCGTHCSPSQSYVSLQYAMYMTCFISVIGGGFFLWAAIYVQGDRARTDKLIKGTSAICNDSDTSSSNESMAGSRAEPYYNIGRDDTRPVMA